jgi:hypothetical protein
VARASRCRVRQASEAFAAAVPDTAIADAKARVKQEGLDGHLTLPDQPSVKSPVLELMIQEAHERRDREAAIARGPQGFIPGALGAITSLGAGMIDPVNAAAFSIPVLGEARWGKLVASAGDSMIARAGVRALQGGAQGAVGTAVLQPADWWLHSQDGQDYTMADALKSVVMGAGMGAAFHAGFGGTGDIMARLRGRPLPGSPEDLLTRGLLTGTHVRGADLIDNAAPEASPVAAAGPEEVPGITPAPSAAPPEDSSAALPKAVPAHPAEVLADLPPGAQEDLVRSAIADITADRPVRAAEVLQIAADHDPRIAESIEAWHGSPHDFDQFDVSKIGAGEGAASFGHGLYFAEEEAVARGYQKRLAGAASDEPTIGGQPFDYANPAHIAARAMERADNVRAAAARDLEQQIRRKRSPAVNLSAATEEAALHLIQSDAKVPSFDLSGSLYKVRIKADQGKMLDWDAPLSQQPQAVKDLVKERDIKFYEPGADRLLATDASQLKEREREPTGAEIYQELQRRRAAEVGDIRDVKGDVAAHVSAIMSDAGIPGIKYLDQHSRGAGEGTRNFVVFDDKHVEITYKNGEPVKREEITPQRETTVTINGKAHEIEYPSQGQRSAAATADPRWRELADAPAAHDEPDAIAESKAADHVEEPASVVPEKSMTAAEQAAADAEEIWRRVEPSLSEDERRVVSDALDRIKTDKTARDQIINDGAACLMAAAA